MDELTIELDRMRETFERTKNWITDFKVLIFMEEANREFLQASDFSTDIFDEQNALKKRS